jgi:ferredoxin
MGIKKKIVSHRRSHCIGCGSCVLLAPKNWKMNEEDGKSDLINGELKTNGIVVGSIDEVDCEDNIKVAEACPVNIIRLN